MCAASQIYVRGQSTICARPVKPVGRGRQQGSDGGDHRALHGAQNDRVALLSRNKPSQTRPDATHRNVPQPDQPGQPDIG